MTDWNNPIETETKTKIIIDDFKKQATYVGPDLGKWSDNLFIRAWKKNGFDNAIYQIYIKDHYSGEWRFYSEAFDANGKQLDFIEISRDVASCNEYGCSYDEHIGINIDKQYLLKNSSSGITIKLYGKAGQEIFHIPAGYIKGFLNKVEPNKK